MSKIKITIEKDTEKQKENLSDNPALTFYIDKDGHVDIHPKNK